MTKAYQVLFLINYTTIAAQYSSKIVASMSKSAWCITKFFRMEKNTKTVL